MTRNVMRLLVFFSLVLILSACQQAVVTQTIVVTEVVEIEGETVEVTRIVTVVAEATEEPAEEPTEEPMEQVALKIAMLHVGPVAGGGWDTVGYEALLALEDEGHDVTPVESVPFPEIPNYFRDYANQGYDVIIGHSGAFADGIAEVAPEYPDSTFFITLGGGEEVNWSPNLVGLGVEEKDIGYLGGYVAGLMTETDNVGWVGSVPLIGIGQAMEAFKLGVQDANPDAEIFTTFTGSFNDVVLGKEAALQMIDQGVDVIVHNADLGGVGVIEAAKERDILVIGNYSDQNALAPQNVITSVILDFPTAYTDLVGKWQRGELDPDQKIYFYGAVNNSVYFSPTYGLVPADVQEKMDQLVEDLRSGAFEVPDVTFTPDS